jgi:phospholipase/lecithinase/hemolysin
MNNYHLRHFFHFLVATVIAMYSITMYAGQGHPFDNIIFFGDSLTDNGNLYGVDFGFLPKSPPYYQGRFSNATVWSDNIANYFYNKNHTSTINYAIGGESVVLHNPLGGYLPYTLTESIYSYLGHNVFNLHKEKTLFVIWIGANDYLSGPDHADELTTSVVDTIKAAIENLIYHGAMNFLIVNMPDLAKIPYCREEGINKAVSVLTALHNEKLSAAIANIQDSYKEVNIHLYDVNALFTTLLVTPDVLNAKYHTHISNTVTACWMGGYSLREARVNEEMIYQQLVERMQSQLKLRLKLKAIRSAAEKNFDAKEFAHHIATTPALREAYVTTERAAMGVTPCVDPDSRVFWDRVHPTAVVHNLLSNEITAFINANYSLSDV